MHAVVRKIGNSSGVVIPKPLLAQIGVETGENLDMSVNGGKLILAPVKRRARAGWAEAVKKLAQLGDDALVWPEFGNADDESFKW